MAVQKFLDSRGLAKMLGVKPQTLAKWRLQGIGPPYVFLGTRCVRYDEAAVEAWLHTRKGGRGALLAETAPP